MFGQSPAFVKSDMLPASHPQTRMLLSLKMWWMRGKEAARWARLTHELSSLNPIRQAHDLNPSNLRFSEVQIPIAMDPQDKN